MMFIPYAEYEQANELVKELFDDQINTNGRVTNMKKTLLHSPKAFLAYQEWYPLKDDVAGFVGERAALLFANSISTGNECVLCSTFFRKAFVVKGEDPANIVLDDTEELLVRFGAYIAKSPNDIPSELYKSLDERFSKVELVKLVAFAGLMAATNLFNSVLKVEVDDYLEGFQVSFSSKTS